MNTERLGQITFRGWMFAAWYAVAIKNLGKRIVCEICAESGRLFSAVCITDDACRTLKIPLTGQSATVGNSGAFQLKNDLWMKVA